MFPRKLTCSSLWMNSSRRRTSGICVPYNFQRGSRRFITGTTSYGKYIAPQLALKPLSVQFAATRHDTFCVIQTRSERRSYSSTAQDPKADSNDPPPRPSKSFDRELDYIAIGVLAGTNIVVWYLFKILEDQEEGYERRARIMRLLFIEESGVLLGERPWTLITSSFVHYSWKELLRNLMCISIVAVPLVKLVGGPTFLAIYLSGGVGSRVARYILSITDPECRNFSVVGKEFRDSEGACTALMSAYVCLQPFVKRWLGPKDLSYFPLAYMAVFSVLWLDVLYRNNKHTKAGQVLAASWLGGAATGVLFYFVGIRPRLYRHFPYGF